MLFNIRVWTEHRARLGKTAGMYVIFVDIDRNSKKSDRTTDLQPLYADIFEGQIEAYVKSIIASDHGYVISHFTLFHSPIRQGRLENKFGSVAQRD